MSTVCVAQPLPLRAVFNEEERSVGAVAGVLVEKLIHRRQQGERILRSVRALAPQIRLEVRHQQRSGNSFAGDIADHQSYPFWTKRQKVVVITAHLPRLNAYAVVIKRSGRRRGLWEQARLYLLGNFQF